jgi:hypothetical protein
MNTNCDLEHGGCTATTAFNSNVNFACRETETLGAGLVGGFALGVVFAVFLFGLTRHRRS